MIGGRLVQILSGLTLVGSVTASGMLLPSILESSRINTLRYTEDQVENAPPEVAIGRAIGALRGILVDVLWVRATILKEKGLYYEANALAEMITNLQPRFSSVWAFQGHNMAYNISVATDTQAERWSWVQKGLDLVRNEGLRFNPNDVDLYRELSFWFSHKIEGIADDAHIYYKTQFAREWHYILGEPPFDEDARLAWIEKVANAPDSYEAAVKRTPKVEELVNNLRQDLASVSPIYQFKLDSEFLRAYGNWVAVNKSWYASVMETAQELRRLAEEGTGNNRLVGQFFVTLDKYANDPEFAEAWETLLAYVRKTVLRNEFNMDAKFMAELERKWGPIDWRHASAHALYWARMGARKGELRAHNQERRFKIVNNDRQAAHSMQDLARYGLMSFDPMSSDVPSRLPDRRWIPVINEFFQHLYRKHIEMGTDGWGPDNFIAWHENFLKSAVRELYRMGDKNGAQELLDELDRLYGTGHTPPNPTYAQPLDTFVQEQTYREYDMQPHVATTDVTNAMYYAIRFGLGRGNKEVYEEAKRFAENVLDYFRFNHYSDFVNKFGVERISGIIRRLEQVEIDVFARIMLDPSVPLEERLRIYNVHTPVEVQREIYDFVKPGLVQQLEQSKLAGVIGNADKLIPEPPGIEQVRQRRVREQQLQQQNQRAPIETR